MISTLRVTQALLALARSDLDRPHPFAFERVGFFRCRFGVTPKGGILILAHDYHPVADDDYIDDNRYGALIGSNAFRRAMQLAYSEEIGLFHVHLHDHDGVPVPSSTDFRETQVFVPDFFNVRPNVPHGALILSRDALSGRAWDPRTKQPHNIERTVVVGVPIRFFS